MEICKLDGGFSDKPVEGSWFPKFSGAGIPGIDGKLRRHQNRIDARSGYLRGDLLAIVYITSERRTVAVEINNDDAGAADIKFFGNVKENPTFAVSLILPEYAPKPCLVTFSFSG